MNNTQKIYGPFKQLLTLQGLPLRGPISDDRLEMKEDHAVLVENGMIREIAPVEQLRKTFPGASVQWDDAVSRVALPAFVDCHTHICWGGTRVNDYAMRVAGKSYLEIAATGGGIMDTVTETRKATDEQLIEGILKRVDQHLKRGITTIEIKSGYGLNLKDELRMLWCIRAANERTSAELIPTFLGAHIKPNDFEGSHKEYLDFMISEVVPVIMKEGLAGRADIFVEEGAFGVVESREYASRLKEQGFDITMHVDQFHSGGSKMACELGAVSADHLESLGENDIAGFGASETVAVALPGASLGLGMQFTPARKLLDAQACLAIATDWNPGSAPMGDLITQASVIGAAEKLTIAETLAAVTYRAAHALRIEKGMITPGKKADLLIFETDDFRNIFYQQGQLRPSTIVTGEEFISNV